MLKTLADPFDDDWHANDLYSPVAHMTVIDISYSKTGSIITIDMDGMCGAERDLILKCEVMDPRLGLCRPGFALVSKIFCFF